MLPKFSRRRLLTMAGGAAVLNLGAVAAAHLADGPTASTSPPPSIEAFAAPPFVDKIALSPDGTRVAIISQVGDEKRLVHFKIGEAASQPLSLGKSKIRDLFFADNQRLCLITSAAMFSGWKYEFAAASIIDPFAVTNRDLSIEVTDGGFYGLMLSNVRRVKLDGKYRIVAGGVIGDGHGLAMANLYAFDTEHGLPRLIARGNHDSESWITTPDGFALGYSEYSDETKVWQLFFNQAKPGEPQHFSKIYETRGALKTPDLIGAGRDGQSLVVYLRDDTNAGTYHEISKDGAMGPALDQDSIRNSGPLFNPISGRLAGFAKYDDWVSYDYFDPLMKKLSDGLGVAVGDNIRVRVEDFAEDPRKMILYAESAEDAGGYFFIDFTTGDSQRLASSHPGVPAEWVSQKQAIDYKAADGLNIHGYLTLPPFKTPKALPLVVMPHGGPQSRDMIDFDWQAQLLASRGYAVLQPNFRGSTGYGTDFVAKGYGEWGRKMQSDLSDGVRWLAAQGTIDPNRVAIMGASYGGYAALAGATLEQGVYRCAVAIAAPSDLGTMVNDLAIQRRDTKTDEVLYWKRFMGELGRYDDISPAKQATRANCPILLLHGTDDSVVLIDQSQRMERALKAAGKSVEFVSFKGQDHWLSVGSARVEMAKLALAFLARHNPA